MLQKTKYLTSLLGVITLSVLFIIGSCNLQGTGSGVMELSISDAPVNDPAINGVYITIEDVQYVAPGGGWQSMNEFEAAQTYNLLELTGGNSELLGNLTLPANEHEQIRFILSAPDKGTQFAEGNSGSWVNYDENAEFN